MRVLFKYISDTRRWFSNPVPLIAHRVLRGVLNCRPMTLVGDNLHRSQLFKKKETILTYACSRILLNRRFGEPNGILNRRTIHGRIWCNRWTTDQTQKWWNVLLQAESFEPKLAEVPLNLPTTAPAAIGVRGTKASFSSKLTAFCRAFY